MFAPPEVIETEVFASVPDTLRRPGAQSTWLNQQMRGVSHDCFLEGPSFDRDGNLWVTDIPFGRIFRVDPAGNIEQVAEYDGEPNGLKFHKDGRIFIADHKHGIMLLDPASGAVTPFFDRPALERFKGVNDLFFAANGDLYFTDQGQTGLHDPTGRLYRITAESGRLECLLNNVPSPNGLVFNKAETQMFLAVTRMNAVWRVPLMENNFATKVGVAVYLNGGMGPDGMALDSEGNLVVCHAGFGSVWVFSPIGEPLYRIKSCTGMITTNCAYGGPDGKSLFITESGSGTILRAEMPVAGETMYGLMD